MLEYLAMLKIVTNRGYSIRRIGILDAERIRRLRNKRIQDLRQSIRISPIQQQVYFLQKVWFGVNKVGAGVVLRALANSHGRFVGYMGLVHINNELQTAELSTLLISGQNEKSSIYRLELEICIAFGDQLARELGITRIVAEVFNHRPVTLEILLDLGFRTLPRDSYPINTIQTHLSANSFVLCKFL